MTLFERRLRAEWDTLQQLALLNPSRLTHLAAADTTFTLVLHGPPVTLAQGTFVQQEHALRIVFPVHFPAAPMELYLNQPVLHPNVHPETGFVCLWEKHRVSYTVEHALHRTVAMLAGRLFNPDAPHVMQPDALKLYPRGSANAEMLLLGIDHSECEPVFLRQPRRRRLQ